jgi:DNA-binding MarR family transcriptional regulator/N-acetylglutamate synthase-like GNAT family acetyltransferase
MRYSKAIKEIRAFNRFYTNILGLVDRHILDSPYSLTEARILFEIFHNRNCSARKINNLLRVDEGYLSRTIDKLIKQDLITKKQSRKDKRVFILSLSKKGEDEFLKLNKASEVSIESMIDHLAPDEVDEIESTMRRIEELLTRKGGSQAITLEDISIRNTMIPGDLGYVVYLHGLLYGIEYDYGIEFETYVAHGLYEFFQNYDQKKDRVWICEHDKRMVLFLLLMHRDNNTAQLRYFLIVPEYRGIGLGKKLMELFLDFLHRCHYQSAYLWTTHELYTAASLYTRYGFELTEEKESNAFGKLLREQRYDLIVG